MTICSDSEEGEFAELLFDYNEIDLDTFKAFLDCSMPSISVYSYSRMTSIELVSSIVTLAEEAFGAFILENNWKRWIHQARNKFRINLQEDNCTKDEPKLLYQKNITQRSDGKSTAGQWTESGISRYNEIVSIVSAQRSGRIAFEEELKDLYIEEMNEKGDMRQSTKRKMKAKIDEERKKKTGHSN